MINQDWGGVTLFSRISLGKKGWVISSKTTGPSDIPSNSFRITRSIHNNFDCIIIMCKVHENKAQLSHDRHIRKSHKVRSLIELIVLKGKGNYEFFIKIERLHLLLFKSAK